MYAPPDHYAWDFWLVEDGGCWHLFHLQAPRSLHPEARHHHASVRHAVSDDLEHWEPVGTALAAGPAGDWDDRCIWTGSILAHGGRFLFLYTGRERGASLVQRIGLATSTDLYRWERHPRNPVLEPDPLSYEVPRRPWLPVADWRDPFLCVLDGTLTALVTARLPPPPRAGVPRRALAMLHELATTQAPGGRDGWTHLPARWGGRGCIARATSEDGVRWTVHEPLFAPGTFGSLECPQLFAHRGSWYLTFSTLRGWFTREHARARGDRGQTGVMGVWGPTWRGPWSPVNGDGVILGTRSDRYATRFVRWRESWWALSWRFRAGGDGFCGRIERPLPVEIEGERVQVRES